VQKGVKKISPFFIPYAITNMGGALLAIDQVWHVVPINQSGAATSLYCRPPIVPTFAPSHTTSPCRGGVVAPMALSPLQGFMGPNYSISTACATANYAFVSAANHIRAGDADVMVVSCRHAWLSCFLATCNDQGPLHHYLFFCVSGFFCVLQQDCFHLASRIVFTERQLPSIDGSWTHGI
jgi:hypothetical protein